MPLVDSHCHLNADRFDADVDDVLDRARAAGLERILVPGWNVWSCERALELADAHPWLDASVGVHPHDAAKVDDASWASIAVRGADPRVVAIGETGLDYDRVFSPIPDQLTNLRRNLRARARDRQAGHPALPLGRGPAGRTGRAARRAAGGRSWRGSVGRSLRGAPPAVIHSFSGPVDYALAVLDLGLAISFSGLAFRGGEEASREVAGLVPADRLLVETDFAVPCAARRAAFAQRARMGQGDGRVGRPKRGREALEAPRRRAGRRLRPHVPEIATPGFRRFGLTAHHRVR